MIRPFTFVTMLLAAGAGLFLYQAKQQGRVLDHQIDSIRGRAAATHQRAEVLRAEYTLLNDPSRLAELASTYLPDLKPTQPSQWTSLAEMDKRLPPVGGPTATPAPLEPSAPDAVPPKRELTPMAAAKPAPATRHEQPALAAAEPARRPATHETARVEAAHVGTARVETARIETARIESARFESARTAAPSAWRHATAHPTARRPAIALARRTQGAAAHPPVRLASTHLAPVPLTPPPTRATSRSAAPMLASARPVWSAPVVERPAPHEPPVVASALGMARMLTPVTPAMAATLPQSGSSR